MYKKMLCTILSAMLILSLVAVMPAMAAVDKVGTEYFRDDFENYVADTEYGVSSSLVDKDGVTKWATTGGTGAKIVTVKGYDGNDTQAVKVYLLDNSSASSNGARRFNAKPVDYENNTPTTGIAVTEMSIYMPDGGNHISTFTTSTIRRQHSNITLCDDANAIGTYPTGGWVKVKIVTDLDNSTSITYVNDVMTTYRKYTSVTTAFPAGKTTFNRIQAAGIDAGVTTDFVPGQHYMLIDDVNMYYAPEAAAPVATYPANNDTGVTFATNPSVTFNFPLMNVINTLSEHADAVLPANAVVTNDNVTVEVIECTDESKLGEIEAEVTLSNSNKTLNIKPAEEFPGNAKIRVTVSGLRDDLDRDVAETSFEFRTMEKVELTGAPVFRKENLVLKENNVISTIQNGYISCDYTLTNAAGASAVDALFFAVLKVDGVVERFQFKPVTVGADGGTATFKGGFNVKDAANSSIEVYVWDSMKNMTSFVPMVSLDANGLTTAQ